MGVDGIAEELEDASILLATGRNHRPDAFAPTLPTFATRPLGDVTVDHDVSNRLFRLVICRLDPRRRQEAKVVVRLPAAKTLRQRLGLRTRRRAAYRVEKPSPDPIHRTGKPRFGHVLGTMPSGKHFPDPWQKLVAPDLERLVGVFGQKANVTDQMGPAELNQHATIRHILVVRRKVVRPDDAPESLRQDRLEDIGAARGVDVKDGEVQCPETPRPELLAAVFVSGFIRAIRHDILDFYVRELVTFGKGQ